MPMPRQWAPFGDSYEHQPEGKFCFYIEIRYPLLGLIVKYIGFLAPVSLLIKNCSRQTEFDQRAEKWVTTIGGWRWPCNRALRGTRFGHSNFGTWSNLHRRQHALNQPQFSISMIAKPLAVISCSIAASADSIWQKLHFSDFRIDGGSPLEAT